MSDDVFTDMIEDDFDPPPSLTTMKKKWKCPTCGTKQEVPHRPPVGTQVVHRKLGIGVIISYDHCDEISCIVEFKGEGWCMFLSELTPKP
jgi:hypothetical protein